MQRKILDIPEMKELARRRVPKLFFEYADSGSFTESTYRANEADFAAIKFRQRVLVDMADRSLESTMIGERVSMPVALARPGLTGMQHADGEIPGGAGGRGLRRAVPLSTMRSARSRTSPATPRSPSGSSSTSCGTAVRRAS